SASGMVTRSRPLNRMDPPTIRPFLPRSRITPSATVDLPQPDSPTSPSASPGRTLTEKSITAGISPARLAKLMERFSISRMGSVTGRLKAFPQVEIRLTRSGFAGYFNMLSICPSSDTSAISVLQALLTQRIRQQDQPQHQTHDRQRREQVRVPIEQQQRPPLIDGRS